MVETRSIIRFLIVFVLSIYLSGCAIYDSKRGPLVTSSPVAVKTDGYPVGYVIDIEGFLMSAEGDGANVTTHFGMAGIPVTHKYIFNEVDKENLQESLHVSLKASGVKVNGNNTSNKLKVIFDFIGMINASYGYVVPLIKGKLIIIESGKERIEVFEVIGEERSTVIDSKESGIRKFVETVHGFLINSADKKY